MTIRVLPSYEVLSYNEAAFQLLKSSLPDGDRERSSNPETMTYLFEKLRTSKAQSLEEAESIFDMLRRCKQEKVVLKNCFMLSAEFRLPNEKQFQVDCVLISSDVYIVCVKLMLPPASGASESSYRRLSVCREFDEDESKMEALKQISALEARLVLNKKFLYMVIHDLKHPSDNINYNLL